MILRTLDGFEMFPWNKNFETGIHEIDAQHKHLVEILNQLAFYLGHRAESDDLNAIFEELFAYADYHFKSEELIWDSYLKDDEDVISHHQTHDSFIAEVVKLKKEEATQPIDDVIENILKFLSRWLAIHILNTDTRMAKIVLALRQGLDLVEAKKRAESEMTGEKAVLIDAILQMYEQLSERTLALMREKSERRLFTENITHEAASNFIPNLCCVVDESLQVVSWNESFQHLTGSSSDALLDANFISFFEQQSHQEILSVARRAMDDGLALFEGILIPKGGTNERYQFSATLLLDNQKKTLLMIGVKTTSSDDVQSS